MRGLTNFIRARISGPSPFILFLALACVPSVALADTFTFSTPTGATQNGHPVDVTAIFTATNGELLITLINQEANPTTDDQGLVDFSFDLDHDISPTITSSTQTLSFSSGTDPAAISSGFVPLDWATVVNPGTSTTIGFCDNPVGVGVCGSHGASTWPHPDESLLGKGAGTDGNDYSNANGSLTNSNHDGYYYYTATYTLTGTGLANAGSWTGENTISSVEFIFGTDQHSAAEITNGIFVSETAPEPGSLALLVVGLALLGIGLRARGNRPRGIA